MTVFELAEVSLGNASRLYGYKQSCPLDIGFNLKGFDYAWLICNHAWKPGEKVLDVGGAYSNLPVFIQKTYGCETWVVDDFGIDVNDPFWARHKSPQEHITGHPEVRYILERVGDPENSSLPAGYFDVVYSASVLEHVPAGLTRQVWQHMGALVKPGGELLHAVDVPFPSNNGLQKFLEVMLFDIFNEALPINFREAHFLSTPRNYARLASQALGIRSLPKNDVGVVRMLMDPELVTEPLEYGYNRIVKDHMLDFHFQRVGTLLLRFKKVEL
jgi:SAM-dependent methyltransferase